MNSTKNERSLLWTLAGIKFTHILDFMIIMPLGPQLMRAFGISPAEFGVLVSAYALSAFLFSVLGSFIIDRYDRKSAMLFTYAGFILGTLACAFAPGFHFLVIARFITGIFGGMLNALVLAVVGDSFEEKKRATAMSYIMAAFSVASVLGIPVGVYLAATYNWHVPFFAIVGMSLPLLVAIPLFMPSMRKHMLAENKVAALTIYKDIWADRNQIMALLLGFLLLLGQFSIIPNINPYLVSNIGFEEKQISYVYFIGGVLTLFTSPVVGRLSDRYGKNEVFMFLGIISLIPIFLLTHLPVVPIWVALVVTSLFFIFISGRVIPATTMAVSAVMPQNRGGFMSVQTAMNQLAMFIGPLISGLIVTKSADGHIQHYGITGFIAIGFSVLALLVSRKIYAAS